MMPAHEPPLLTALSEALQLRITSKIEDLRDAASLCITIPPLGLAMLRNIPRFQDKLMSVALRLVAMPATARALLDECLLRRFASDRSATPEGCAWLSDQYAAAGSSLRLMVATHYGTSDTCKAWFLYDKESGSLIALCVDEHPSGNVFHYDGGKGEEHIVRMERPVGSVKHYVGGKGEEQLVSVHFPDGQVQHYVDGKGEERKVRVEFPDGYVQHYDGGKGEERMVRIEFPGWDGAVKHFLGGKGDERLVSINFPDGLVKHFLGGTGDERLVSIDFPDGQVERYVDGKGEERLVSVEFPTGSVQHYDGGKG